MAGVCGAQRGEGLVGICGAHRGEAYVVHRGDSRRAYVACRGERVVCGVQRGEGRMRCVEGRAGSRGGEQAYAVRRG